MLGPRRALTGEPLAPVLPVVAAAQNAGLLTGDHVKVLRDAVDDLPGFVDQSTPRAVRSGPGAGRGRGGTQRTQRAPLNYACFCWIRTDPNLMTLSVPANAAFRCPSRAVMR